MSKQLYEEALADVKKLKEIAEDNAKRAILEAVTPRIKDLIENQLLGETNDDDDDGLLLDEFPEDNYVDASMSSLGVDPAAHAAISSPDEEGKITLDLSILTGPDDEMELSMDDDDAISAFISPDKMQAVKAESKIKRIESKVKSYANASASLRETKSYLIGLISTIAEVEDMYSALKHKKSSFFKQLLIKRLTECHKSLKNLTEQETNMKKKFSLNEEDITMTLKGMPDDFDSNDVEIELVSGSGDEEELDLDDEEGGDEEGGDEELDLGDDESGEEELDLDDEGEGEESAEPEEEEKMESRWLKGNAIVEIDENMLRKEISRMRNLREASQSSVPKSSGNGYGDVSDEFEDEDLGDPLEIDLSEADEQDDDDVQEMIQAYESDKQDEDDDQNEADDEDDDEDDDQNERQQQGQQRQQQGQQQVQKQQEVLRRHVASEARIQIEAKQKAQQAKKHSQKKQQEAQQKQKQAQKQKKEAQQKQQEAQQKQKQGKKQEAQKKQQEAQKTQQEAQQKQKQSKKMKEAYVFYAKRFNESVHRTEKLLGILSESIARNGSSKNGVSRRIAENTDTLREKLAEVNLFNAKLLFTNKLLQNESLTKRQKASVIERLDEAQNIREAKLVYESLVKTLRAGSTGHTMSESTVRGVIGSSSRPTRPAAATLAINEGVEAERWAKLAGIIN